MLTVVVLLCGAELVLATPGHETSMRVTAPAAHRATPPRPRPAPIRPPQFVVVGFDGSGGARMWDYWLGIAQRAHAHFTFFLSGVYLIDWAHRMRYHPPEHSAGSSSIGFAETTGDLTIAHTISGVIAGYRQGEEIATHYNGHFCSPDPGSVGHWTAADWRSELRQFDGFLFGTGTKLPFGPNEIVGSRSPCLEGKPRVLYPVLASQGFRYDAGQQVTTRTWPKRELGLWSFPLPELPFYGHTFKVVSMDYNFYANQVDESPARAENEMFRTLWNAFRASYKGKRAPLTIGEHFESWKSWVYDKALARFLLKACALPEVRCDSYQQLANFLDSLPAARLRSYETGRFPPMGNARAIIDRS